MIETRDRSRILVCEIGPFHLDDCSHQNRHNAWLLNSKEGKLIGKKPRLTEVKMEIADAGTQKFFFVRATDKDALEFTSFLDRIVLVHFSIPATNRNRKIPSKLV